MAGVRGRHPQAGLIILDLGLPDGDGVGLIGEIRKWSLAPIIVLRFGDVALDLGARMVTRAGQPVHLTPTEYRLLAALAAHPGKVVSNTQLLREVWGAAHAESGHYLRIYMGHLRQKLEDDPAQPKHLLTKTAVGYRLFLPA